jgi:hypothetical protein
LLNDAFCDEAHCFGEQLPAAMRGRLNRAWKPLPQGWKWKIKVITQGAMMEGEKGTTKYAKCAKGQASV